MNPDDLITQVDRDGTPAQASGYDEDNSFAVTGPPSRSDRIKRFLAKICCFWKSTDNGASGQAVLYRENVHADAGQSEALIRYPPLPGKKCLVLDLDETLVHSSFRPIPNPDFIVPVEIEDVVHKVYVLKRPGVDEFMKRMGEIYEIVIFTASLSKVQFFFSEYFRLCWLIRVQYADPVLDLLDIHKVINCRLFRESCSTYRGNYVKDLSRLGRNLDDVLIIDNSPSSYIFHPENAIAIESWFDDESDRELLHMIDFLTHLSKVPNVRPSLKNAKRQDGVLIFNG